MASSLDDSYCIEMQKAALLMYAIYPCGILIERDCFEMFELLRIWSISQYLTAPFSHCKAMIDNMVHNSGPYFIWYAPLSLAKCMVPFHHASLLLFFLSAVDPDRFLDVHPLSEFVTLVLSSVYCIYSFQLKFYDMHLWAISENLSLGDLHSLH